MAQTTSGASWRAVILRAIQHCETALTRLRLFLLKQRIMAELPSNPSVPGTATKPPHQITFVGTGKPWSSESKPSSKPSDNFTYMANTHLVFPVDFQQLLDMN